jgi:hypothetical protein
MKMAHGQPGIFKGGIHVANPTQPTPANTRQKGDHLMTTRTLAQLEVVVNIFPTPGEPVWHPSCQEWCLTDSDGISYFGSTPGECYSQFAEAMHTMVQHFRRGRLAPRQPRTPGGAGAVDGLGDPLALAVFGAKLVTLHTVLGHPSPVARAALNQLGISLAFRTVYVLGFETLFALVFFVVAGALARLKHDHMPALLASTAFFAFGAAGASLDVLIQVAPRRVLPVVVLGYVYRTTFVVFLYVFPEGRFVPPWTKWLAACWTILVLLIVLPANVPVSIGHWPLWAGTPMQLLLLGTVVYAQVYRYHHISDARQKEQTR